MPACPPGRWHRHPQRARAGQAAASARRAEDAHRAIQAGQPHRRAPLPRQVTLALGTVVLNGVACYAAAQALGGSQAAALAWTGLFLAVLAGGEAALGFCRDRSERAWRALVMVIGLLVILLGGLRLWFLAATGTGLVPAITGACLFMVATAVFSRWVTARCWSRKPRGLTGAAPGVQGGSGSADRPGRGRPERGRKGPPHRRLPRACQATGTQDLPVRATAGSGVRRPGHLGETSPGELEARCPSRAPRPPRLTGLRTGSWITRWIPAR